MMFLLLLFSPLDLTCSLQVNSDPPRSQYYHLHIVGTQHSIFHSISHFPTAVSFRPFFIRLNTITASGNNPQQHFNWPPLLIWSPTLSSWWWCMLLLLFLIICPFICCSLVTHHHTTYLNNNNHVITPTWPLGTVPETRMVGSPDMFVRAGSIINLTCTISYAPELPSFVFWYHNERMINYDLENSISGKGSSISLSKNPFKSDSVVSRLVIPAAKLNDSGNYSCHFVGSNNEPAHIYVHVLQGMSYHTYMVYFHIITPSHNTTPHPSYA